MRTTLDDPTLKRQEAQTDCLFTRPELVLVQFCKRVTISPQVYKLHYIDMQTLSVNILYGIDT